jgi:hypothetical protein
VGGLPFRGQLLPSLPHMGWSKLQHLMTVTWREGRFFHEILFCVSAVSCPWQDFGVGEDRMEAAP